MVVKSATRNYPIMERYRKYRQLPALHLKLCSDPIQFPDFFLQELCTENSRDGKETEQCEIQE